MISVLSTALPPVCMYLVEASEEGPTMRTLAGTPAWRIWIARLAVISGGDRTRGDRREAVGRAHDHQGAIAAAELRHEADGLRLVGGLVAFEDLDLRAAGHALLVRLFQRQPHAVLDRHAAEGEHAAGGVH